MTESTKVTSPPQEQAFPLPGAPVHYPQQAYDGGPFPPPGPPGAYPPHFFYPLTPDGSHPEGSPNGLPPPGYVMAFGPAGVVYYPTPPAQAPPVSAVPPALTRPKRKQVKMACTNCAGVCKRCDDNRPCERCVKYSIAHSCIDGQRKERKRGVKRGPYKRRNKGDGESQGYPDDWSPGTPGQSSSTTSAPIHAVSPFHPEGYYPVYYPPPGTFMPPHEGQLGPDGSPPHPNGHMLPYYIHPGAHPFPYPTMLPPGAPLPPGAHQQSLPQPPPQGDQPPQTINPADAARKPEDATNEQATTEPTVPSKKRPRSSRNSTGKAKKVKVAGKEKEDAPAPVVEQHNADDSD